MVGSNSFGLRLKFSLYVEIPQADVTLRCSHGITPHSGVYIVNSLLQTVSLREGQQLSRQTPGHVQLVSGYTESEATVPNILFQTETV